MLPTKIARAEEALSGTEYHHLKPLQQMKKEIAIREIRRQAFAFTLTLRSEYLPIKCFLEP